MLNYLKYAFTLCCIFVCLPLSAKLITITEKQYQSGGYLIVQAAPYSMVKFLDTYYRSDKKGYLSIGLGRDVSGNKRISITAPSGEVERRTLHIAPVGSTGRATGPHLDWRMNVRDVRVDAALWIKV